ncbi:MAG: T9SS type B sorting domain-containing protein [Bacteroidia bacterium]
MRNALHIWSIFFFLMVAASSLSKAQTVDTVCASFAERVYRVQPTPGSTYFWQVEGGKITSAPGLDSIQVLWSNMTPGFYDVKVVERNKFGCFGDTVRAKVLVGSLQVSIDGKKDICNGQAVLLTAKGAKNYLWNTGATTQTIIANPTSKTDYSVIGYTDICNADTAQFAVDVHPLPKADFSFTPKEPSVNEDITFTYKGKDGTDWKWLFDKNPNNIRNDDNTFVTNYSYTEGGEKIVTLVVSNKAGCRDSISYKIFIDEEAYIFIPTAFTPDGDNLNDVFKPVLTGVKTFELTIYNRWGERIKTLGGEGDTWDGTFRNTMVEQGVYIYTVKAQGNNNRWYHLNGVIQVLR